MGCLKPPLNNLGINNMSVSNWNVPDEEIVEIQIFETSLIFLHLPMFLLLPNTVYRLKGYQIWDFWIFVGTHIYNWVLKN